jgi:hypothetical protein
MRSQIIEPEPQLRFSILPAPGEVVGGAEFQAELAAFSRGLKTNGIDARATWYTHDAVGGGGWSTGEYTLLSVLVPVAIVQFRKLIVEILKMREGRKLKIKVGTTTIEGHVDDIQRIVTPEQIAKLLEEVKKPR